MKSWPVGKGADALRTRTLYAKEWYRSGAEQGKKQDGDGWGERGGLPVLRASVRILSRCEIIGQVFDRKSAIASACSFQGTKIDSSTHTRII
eukprot:2125562-Pyramimonas_sp.AAC.1